MVLVLLRRVGVCPLAESLTKLSSIVDLQQIDSGAVWDVCSSDLKCALLERELETQITKEKFEKYKEVEITVMRGYIYPVEMYCEGKSNTSVL